MVKDPHTIIIRPHITEKTMRLASGDPRLDLEHAERSYTFVVAPDSNKLEIASAIESIYNAGKKPGEGITVTRVRTIKMHGKKRRVGQRKPGYRPDWKKAVVTLAPGQMLEDYGV